MANDIRNIVVIAHDMRSAHNVGSLLRTAEGLGVIHVYFTGYTPYPALETADQRLPHIARKLSLQINKTALGAESQIAWSHIESIETCLRQLRRDGYTLLGLEQSTASQKLPAYNAPNKVALLLGREVEGIDTALLKHCDALVEIPMLGSKESFNVVQAAAMALYQLRFG